MKAHKTILLFLIVLFAVSGAMAQPGTGVAADFAVKAFHLDLRIQVMTMPALKAFAEKLHEAGINTLIMEYEASYPYQKHPLIPGRYAYTREEILSFVGVCNKLGIDVIPLQQSFGHVEYILRHYRYAALREDEKDLSQVCPLATAEDSVLFTDLYTELAGTHTSPYIHIGADETHLLGHCPKCRRKVEKEGMSKLYIDYIKMLCQIVIRLGKRPVLWADIALKYPEALRSLPKGTIFVDWNYGWDLNRFGDHRKLIESGFEIWGAAALRSHPDNYFLEQWDKHFNNIRDFIPQCRQMGYRGIVMTSWSTSGAYSSLYESESDLADLYAVRHVYPITGFNMLLDAYAKSISSSLAPDKEGLILNYCINQYGFTKPQAQEFWSALRAAPYEVKDGMVHGGSSLSLKALTDSLAEATAILNRLEPLKNNQEFAHYRLMADIRLQWLRFAGIEQAANSEDLQPEQIPSLVKQLEGLLKQESSLDQRFIALNKESFYLSELNEENRLRSLKLRLLYERLAKAR